ncbi:MAG: MMPL family transporter, partial [Methylococcaceae bacterium]|nr:MMPL family transporter [Methylococcaceae bacterium]
MNNTEPEELSVNPLWVFLYNEQGELRQASIEQQQLCSDEGLVIGRKQDEPHLEINHNSISKTHCRLFLNSDNQLQIVDLDSRNGIFVNELRLEEGQAHTLNLHDKLRLAELTLTVVFPHSHSSQASRKENATDEEDQTYLSSEDKTIIETIAHQPLHKADENKEVEQGKHVEHHSAFIEQVMTFGARKPLISFLLILLLTVVSAYGLLNLKLDTSYDSMLNKNDPNIPIYNEVIKEFGSDNLILIYYEDDNLFTADKIKIVDDVTYALQDLEIVEKVESLVTTLSIRNSEFGLEINQLISSLPETAEEIAAIKEDALYSPLIRGNHLSKDGKKASIIVTLRPTFNEPEFNRKAYDTIEAAIKPLRAEFKNVFQIGNPRVNVEFENGIFSDLSKITPLAVFVLVGSIVFMLRTSMAAILPLITSGLSIVWALGFLGFSGIPVNLLTAILPALVIVIGSTEDTHMLAAYLQGLSKDHDNPRFPAIRFMAVHVGLPIFITSFTTIIGFLANGFSDITLIRHFGISSAFGMFANLLATILVLPLLLQLFGPKKTSLHSDVTTQKGWIAAFVRFVERASEVHQQKIIIITTVFVLIFGFFALKVTASNDPLSFFKQDNEIIANSHTLHDNLAGMQVFFVTVHA